MIELIPLPPEEAIAYFEQKGYAIGFDHRDVWQQEHQAGFTVAKVMQQDILEDIRKAVDAAIKDGTPLAQFAQQLTPILQDKGWWGQRPMTDPLTGIERDVQLGSPRRLKTIYDTNLRTAHSEGQWARIQANKEAFPYLQYDANNSPHPRQDHSKWDALTLPVDDPFWQRHMPIKAYGCKCRVIPKMASQVAQVDRAPSVPTRTYTNARTGEIQQIPQGVDPSFHYPSGGRRASLNQHLIEKLESVQPPMSRASVADLVNGPAFADWYQAPAGNFAMAYIESSVARIMGANTQLVVMMDSTLAKQAAAPSVLPPQAYSAVQQVIDEGLAVAGNEANSTVYLLEQGESVIVVAVEQEGKDLVMTSMKTLSTEAAKQDVELQQLLAKNN